MIHIHFMQSRYALDFCPKCEPSNVHAGSHLAGWMSQVWWSQWKQESEYLPSWPPKNKTRSNQFIDIFTSHEKIKQPKINEPGLPFIRNLSAKLLRVGHVVHIWHHSNHASSIAKLLHQPEIQTIIPVNIKTYCHRSCCNNSIKILFTSIIPVNNLLSQIMLF